MDTIYGYIQNVEVVSTPIDTYMITFIVRGERCKAYNDLAKMIEGLVSEVQVEGFWRPYRNERELDVRSVKYTNADGGFVTVVE